MVVGEGDVVAQRRGGLQSGAVVAILHSLDARPVSGRAGPVRCTGEGEFHLGELRRNAVDLAAVPHGSSIGSVQFGPQALVNAAKFCKSHGFFLFVRW